MQMNLLYLLKDMSNCSDSSSEDKQSLDDPNVFQVGFNISVSGTPGTGFQVVVNDQDQKLGQLTPSNNAQLQLLPPGGKLYANLNFKKTVKIYFN